MNNTTPEFIAYKFAHDNTEKVDPRHVVPDVSQDPNDGKVYINKPDPKNPQNYIELLINDLSK